MQLPVRVLLQFEVILRSLLRGYQDSRQSGKKTKSQLKVKKLQDCIITKNEINVMITMKNHKLKKSYDQKNDAL